MGIVNLQPHLPFDPAETAISYARRLGLFHNGRGLHRLLGDLNIDAWEFMQGAEHAILAVAAAAGLAPALLMACVFQIRQRFILFRGERLSRAFLLKEGERYCPRCVIDDGASENIWLGKGQVIWRLRPIQTCPFHGCALHTSEVDRQMSEYDFVFPDGPVLAHIAGSVQPQPLVPLEELLIDRLKGKPRDDVSWLQDQTIEQAVLACEMLGAMLLHGNNFAHASMQPEDWRAAGTLGFSFASSGEDGIRAALDDVAKRADTNSGKAGPRAIYGRLYEWLAYTTPVVDHGPIRELLRDHILENLAVGQGDIVLGVPVERRRLHSVHSLSDETGLHRKRLRKILVQFGLTSDDSWDRAANKLVFPAEAAVALCRDLGDSLALHDLPDALGCSRTQATSLYQHGVLPPLVARDAQRHIGKLAFARREVDALLDRIRALPVISDEPDEHVDLVSACKRTGRSTGEILAQVFDDKIPGFRKTGDVAVNRIHIPAACLSQLRILVGAAIARPDD